MSEPPLPELPQLPNRLALRLAAKVVDQLPAITAETRQRTGMTMRDVQAAAGVSVQTLNRIESGLPCTTTTAAKLLRWAATA